MRTVMGIDAAWSLKNPSGVALACEQPTGWKLIAVESSYQRFQARAEPQLAREQRPSGSLPDASTLLSSASKLSRNQVNIVAIDMPLAQTPIIGRRTSDDEVSRAYGARQCGTHTPNADRPGRMSADLRESLGEAGYTLLTDTTNPVTLGLAEVYPHPALVELANAPTRLPYKHSKCAKYWPSATPLERRGLLYEQWSKIVYLLEPQIAGVEAELPMPQMNASCVELKAYEDALDAVVCAWVAICILEGRAIPFGDENSAIWIPMPGVSPIPSPHRQPLPV